MKRYRLLASASVALCCLAGAGRAQTSGPESIGASDQVAAASPIHVNTAEPTSGLAEIVVTAQRRAESLQRAAVAVDVIQGSELVKAGVTDVTTLNTLTPALQIEPSSTGNLLFIRGVGNFTLVPTSDPAIAFNYDGVYIGRPTSTSTAFFDLDRIEVLKGPQGTLYGRNATGGAINILPTQPKIGELSGYGSLSYGNYNDVFFEGAINLPVGENGALRISAGIKNRDGYYTDGTADDISQSFRVQLKAQLTPDLLVRVAADYSHQGGVGQSVDYLGSYQYAGPAAGYVFLPSNLPRSEGIYTPAAQAYRQTGFAGSAGRHVDALAPYPFRRNDFYGTNAEIDYDTGVGKLTVIPAYRISKLDYLSDAAAFTSSDREHDDQFSIEARFTGTRISIFDYTVGALYYDEQIDASGAIFISSLAATFRDRLSTKSYAPFGRLTANLTGRLRLVGGVRYTHDSKTFSERGTSGLIVCLVPTGCPNAPLFPYVTDFSQLPFPFPTATQVPPIVPAGGGAIALRQPRLQDNALTNGKVTYRGAVEFDVAPRSLLYASVETGFRSGGFSGAAGFETYQPETITAYTVGAKNRFFANRLQLNVEGFYWDYRNQQVNFVGPDINGVAANQTRNIGKSRIYGAEAEAAVLVTKSTLLSANIQYLDTKQEDFVYPTGNGIPPPLTGCTVQPNANPLLVNINCSGFPAYNSPKWTVNLAAQQTVPLNDYNLVFNVDTQYRTSRYLAFQYLAQQLEPATWQTNAQVSFGLATGPLDDHGLCPQSGEQADADLRNAGAGDQLPRRQHDGTQDLWWPCLGKILTNAEGRRDEV